MHKVADVIYNQLGGNKFSAMVGGTMVAGTNCLNIHFKGGKDKINHVSIVLDSDDTYTLTFADIKGKYTIVKTIEGVHAAELAGVFEDVTGLHTKMR